MKRLEDVKRVVKPLHKDSAPKNSLKKSSTSISAKEAGMRILLANLVVAGVSLSITASLIYVAITIYLK